MLDVGQSLGPWRIDAISPADIRELAQILRDPNPIHLDPAAVAKLGLGERVINQGPANLAYIINMLSAAIPAARLVELDARFLANVFAGDTVEAGGKVTSVERTAGGTRIGCEVWLNVASRGAAVAGNALLLATDQGNEVNR